MVGKYLEENCLRVTEPEAVEALYNILKMEPMPVPSSATCNKSYEERSNFLKKISGFK